MWFHKPLDYNRSAQDTDYRYDCIREYGGKPCKLFLRNLEKERYANYDNPSYDVAVESFHDDTS